MTTSPHAKPPRTDTLARGAITGLAVARVGMAKLGRRIRPVAASVQAQTEALARHEAELGRILYQAMSQLRGTALKVSQLLSMNGSFLPEGVRRELARACHQVTPLNRALVGRVFRQDFGREPETLYARFDPTAFAAASLGQVHRAELPGHGTVAVKVQYPGIAATIPSDMRLMRAALKALGQGVLPNAAVVNRIMDEVEATLLQEVDYLHEARQLQWFAHHAALPGVLIPQPVMSHTTAHVLTQTYLEGLHLQAWLDTRPAQDERNRFGQHLFDWFMHCAFGLGHVHADLHPGNFLFMPDGRLGVLDFGCTRELSSGFRDAVAQAWSALLAPASAQQRQILLLCYRSLGLVACDLDETAFAEQLMPALAPMQRWQTEPFRSPVFDFAHKSPPPPLNLAHQRCLAHHVAAIPPEMPAFERAWMGLMHLLSRLGAQVNTTNRWIR